MRRAARKLLLSRNVIGDDVLDHEGSNGENEVGDLKSVIFGLHVFDPAETNAEKSDNQLNISELTELAKKVIASRVEINSDSGDRKFEINPMDLLDGHDLVLQEGSESNTFDPDIDEASYLSWVEKFKLVSPGDGNDILEAGNRRRLPDEQNQKTEAARKKSEEEKLAKWESLGYHSLSVSIPDEQANQDAISDSGAVKFVYGDCTNTAAVSPSEPTVIFRYISRYFCTSKLELMSYV